MCIASSVGLGSRDGDGAVAECRKFAWGEDNSLGSTGAGEGFGDAAAACAVEGDSDAGPGFTGDGDDTTGGSGLSSGGTRGDAGAEGQGCSAGYCCVEDVGLGEGGAEVAGEVFYPHQEGVAGSESGGIGVGIGARCMGGGRPGISVIEGDAHHFTAHGVCGEVAADGLSGGLGDEVAGGAAGVGPEGVSGESHAVHRRGGCDGIEREGCGVSSCCLCIASSVGLGSRDGDGAVIQSEEIISYQRDSLRRSRTRDGFDKGVIAVEEGDGDGGTRFTRNRHHTTGLDGFCAGGVIGHTGAEGKNRSCRC